VQRCSGTAILSARRQSRALNMSPAPGGLSASPLLLLGDSAVARLDMAAADAGGDGRAGGGEPECSLAAEGSDADGNGDGLADDEEYAVEEEAHRCARPQGWSACRLPPRLAQSRRAASIVTDDQV